MKKIISLLLLFIASFDVSGQGFFGSQKRIVNDALKARGVHYYDNDNISSGELSNAANYGIVGVHRIYNWNLIETADGTFNFTDFFDNSERFANAGLYYTVQFNTGPDAPIGGATDWLADLGVATFTSSGGNENGPYPDYYDPVYETQLHQFYDAINAYIRTNFTATMKRFLLAQYVVLGSTGDTGPWKGNSCTPSNCLGYADDNTWKEWSFEQVQYVQQSIHNYGLTHTAGFNEGNNHESLDRLYLLIPWAFTKNGEYSHDINFLAETVAVTASMKKFMLRGEAQGEILNTTHAHRDGFQMVISALCAGMDIFNITGGWLNGVVESGESAADPRMTNYFVKYAPHNRVASARKGFIQLADKFSFDDVTRFSTGTYGGLIGNTSAYNSRVSSINGDATLGALNKQWLLIDAVRDYVNSTRVDNISDYAETLGAPAYNPSAGTLAYGNPYGYSQFENYCFHITQNSPHTTSLGTWLTGADTSIFGQYGRKFITTVGAETMTFDINNKWAGGTTLANVSFTITYYNSGTGVWSLYANKSSGMTYIGQVTKTNTGKFLQYTVTVNDMVLGTGSDFQLLYNSGNNTEFNMIEISL